MRCWPCRGRNKNSSRMPKPRGWRRTTGPPSSLTIRRRLAARTTAAELLPRFKSRFDLVERWQVGALLQDLKIDAVELQTNERGRSELCRLAKARYLVVGSVSRLYGVSVNARLVDVQS